MKFQLWSTTRKRWWRPGGQGYTDNQNEAGWFGYKSAFEAAMSSSFGSPPGEPGLVLVDPNGLRFSVEFERPVPNTKPKKATADRAATS